MSCAQAGIVIVAMPTWEGRISPVLDVAGRFMVIQFNKGLEISRRDFLMGQAQAAAMVDGIKEMGADVLICGALSQPLAQGLAREVVRVVPHICGEVDAVVQAFLLNKLSQAEFRMPGCCQSLCGHHESFRLRRGCVRRAHHNERIRQ